MADKRSSPPVDVPCVTSQPQAAFNTPIPSQAQDLLQEFPFTTGQDKYSRAIDLSQLSRHLHKVEISRLGDDLAFALGAF